MAKTHETSQAKNVTNLETLIKYLQILPNYAPTRQEATIEYLTTLYQQGRVSLGMISELAATYSDAVIAQEKSFSYLATTITRVVNAFKSVVDDEADSARAVSLGKLITATRHTASKSATKKEETKDSAKTISTSHRSYDNMVNNFASLLDELKAKDFNPNELGLKLPMLQEFQQKLATLTAAVDPAEQALLNARNARNNTFYNPVSGLIPSIKRVKTYISSTYGADSPELRYVQKLKFVNIAKDKITRPGIPVTPL